MTSWHQQWNVTEEDTFWLTKLILFTPSPTAAGMMWKDFLFRSSLIVCCLIGMIIQISNVSSRYFKYKTQTTVHIGFPLTTTFHSLSLCVFLHEVLVDRRDVSSKTKNYKIKDWFEKNSRARKHSWSRFWLRNSTSRKVLHRKLFGKRM